ncbi:ABC-type transporter, integral membrane subunit [Desulfovibrio sp. X2]|uniref:ABC transporter permease n=1 Tax=Desulfovibrio sp. X2 TaxID=941449 RepID=UPI000358BC77|nr:ABC transporter permease subunit [Desulfovibrio sp. X2]EPR37384.1 ABC-type transporter, integral membrane subunit [Desulfovibrio sp. X2]
MLRAAPWLTLGIFLLPVGAGLFGTLLPALGWFPALGARGLGLAEFVRLSAMPGIWRAAVLSLLTGLLTALLSLGITALVCARAHGSRLFLRLQASLAPMLAAPYAAVAIGFAFLVAPSGLFARLLSPWLTGWAVPPDLLVVHDSWGLCMVAGMLLKTVPYLLFMTIAALDQVRGAEGMAVARSLGYAGPTAWLRVIFPQVYPQIRLPVYAVLAFAMSVVDVGIILGPTTPPTLSVAVYRLFTDRDINLILPASAGALAQLALVAGAVLLWRLCERLAATRLRGFLTSGRRGRAGRAGGAAVGGLAGLLWGLFGLGMLALVLWSLAGSWWFPDTLPGKWSLRIWQRTLPDLGWPVWNTLAVGLLSTGLSLALVLGCLENEARHGLAPAARRTMWLLYVPLLVPQIAFLFGLQTFFVRLRLDGTLVAVAFSHTLFVLPYVFLSLADPWRALDERYVRSAACLGASPGRIFWRVKLPLLARPVAFAAAVGFAVSVAQYLPTVFAGAGRLPTLTTEAVTLASGGDRRVAGVYALAQSALPLAFYALAMSAAARRRSARRVLRPA